MNTHTPHKPLLRPAIAFALTLLIFISLVPINAFATGESESGATWVDDSGATHSFTILDNGFEYTITYPDPGSSESSGSSGSAGGAGDGTSGSSYSGSSSASISDRVIRICKDYSAITANTGVRNQIYWLSSLNSVATTNFVSGQSFGDVLLISVLNHEKILSDKFLKSSHSLGDINQVVAGRIAEQAGGYADIASIAAATGLSAEKVSEILSRIAAGTVTIETINQGKNASQSTNRGAYLRAHALEQEKVYTWLSNEVERMTNDEASLAILCDDLGGGYVKDLLAGQSLDPYRILLYKEYLAKVLDEDQPYTIADYDITSTDEYKVSKKVRSALSGIFSYEIDAADAARSEELRNFLDKSLENDVLSESEAREYLILSGQYKAGEHGIGEAAKQLSNGWKHLTEFKKVLDASGKVFDTLDKIKKADEFVEYWATDYARQEILLDELVDSLSESGADADLLVAAKELRAEYEDKLSGTYNKIYAELIDKGIGAVKASFPPLKITETCISLGGMITGASDRADAIETCLAMQGICKEAIASYKEAVIAVSEGDESEEAVAHVLTTFGLAKQSLTSFYKSMIELTDSSTEKAIYNEELNKLENLNFFDAFISPFSGNGGSAGGR